MVCIDPYTPFQTEMLFTWRFDSHRVLFWQEYAPLLQTCQSSRLWPYSRAAPSARVVSCDDDWFLTSIGDTANCLDIHNTFYMSGLVFTICLLLLVNLLGLSAVAMLLGLQGMQTVWHPRPHACDGIMIVVADEVDMIHGCPVLQSLRKQSAALFTSNTDTTRSGFAQQVF